MSTTVYVLGSGTPTPTAARFGSAFAVNVDGELLMVDCGPAATWKLVKVGLRPTDVNTLFFTHHHFDHDVDYPCFLLTRWDQGAGLAEQLHALGPAPTSSLTERLVGASGVFFHDINARIHYPVSQRVYVARGGTLPRQPPTVHATDIDGGYVHETSNWVMRSTLARHAQPYLHCLSYRLDTPDASIMFTGDTEPCDTVRDLAKNADIMLSMCWDTDDAMTEHGEHEGQCSLEGSVRMAADADVGTLILVHTGPHVSAHGTIETALARMGNTYQGQIIFAEELMRLDVSRDATSPLVRTVTS